MNSALPNDVKPLPETVSVAGHFGELAQGLLAEDGPLVLVTLPRLDLSATATIAPDAPQDAMVEATRACLARRFDRSFTADISVAGRMRPLSGAGSSTARYLAILRLMARDAALTLRTEDEADILLELEGAVDPLMLNNGANCLWASREARVHNWLPPLPAMLCVGGYAGKGHATDASDQNFPVMPEIFEEIRAACALGDVARLGAAALASAELNQSRNPNPCWDAANAIAQRFGAAGIAVAHTGCTLTLLFPPEESHAALHAGVALETAGLEAVASFAITPPAA